MVPLVSSFPSLRDAIQARAAAWPDRVALRLPMEGATTYGALWSRAVQTAQTLRARGLGRGDRVLVLAPLSSDLYVAVLGVWAAGGVAVLASAHGGLRPFARAVRLARPRAVLGTRRLLRKSWLVPALWRVGIRVAIPSGGTAAPDAFEPVRVEPGESALLTFTSGTTGRPKGADRTHGTLAAQHEALAAAHPAPPDAAALTCFPVAVLHHLCCGHTALLPDLDLRDVSAVRPERLLAQIRRHGVSLLTGPPPVLQALADHVLAQGERDLPLRQVGVGGAPVPRRLLVALGRAFPEAEARVLYGSTEAEPVAALDAADALAADPDGRLGYPAGYVDAHAEVKLLRLHDAPITLAPGDALDAWRAADGAWGEVAVAGPHVVGRYVGAPEAERRHKICDEHGRLWHRMGDVARRDGDGRLWLGGRLGRLLPGLSGDVPPFPLELQIERLPGIRRVALHAYRGQVLAWLEGDPEPAALRDAEALLQEAGLPGVRFCPLARLPVDARHRWKVDYAALDWRAARLPRR